MKKDNKESKFELLQELEARLEKKVKGYVGKASVFESLSDYEQIFTGDNAVSEKMRLSDTIKMSKSISLFEKNFGKSPKLDYFGVESWEEQLVSQREMVKNNIDVQIFLEGQEGQLIIHNEVSSTHSIVEFEVEVGSNGLGEIILSEDGKDMYPKLDGALKELEVNVKDGVVQLSTEGLLKAMKESGAASQVFEEMAKETGPVTLDFSSNDSANEPSDGYSSGTGF